MYDSCLKEPGHFEHKAPTTQDNTDTHKAILVTAAFAIVTWKRRHRIPTWREVSMVPMLSMQRVQR